MSPSGRVRIHHAFVALALLTAVGCSPSQDEPQVNTTATRPPSATDPTTVGPATDLSTVRPLAESEFELLGSVPALKKATSTGILAVGADGSTLVYQRPFTGDDTVQEGELILHRGGPSGTATRIAAPEHKDPQHAISAVFDERWVVWMETTASGVDVQPWTLYAHDLQSGLSRELARSPEIDGGPPPPPPGFTGLTMADGIVYWAQVGGHFGAETVGVYGCRPADCSPVLFADGAAFPSATDDGLYVIATARYTGRKRTRASQMTIQRVDPATRMTTEIANTELESSSQVPGGLAASDRSLVWIEGGRPSTAVVLDLDTKETTRVTSEQEGLFGYPVATGRFVAWAESSGSSMADVGGYVFQPATGQLSSIGNTAGLYAIHGAGAVVSWQEASTPAARLEDIAFKVVELL